MQGMGLRRRGKEIGWIYAWEKGGKLVIGKSGEKWKGESGERQGGTAGGRAGETAN